MYQEKQLQAWHAYGSTGYRIQQKQKQRTFQIFINTSFFYVIGILILLMKILRWALFFTEGLDDILCFR